MRAVDRDDDHYLRSGNLLLDGLLGATVHVVDDDEAAFIRFAALAGRGRGRRHVACTASDRADRTRSARWATSPPVSSWPTRSATQGLDLGRVVVAASTAGTAAGLILGLAAGRGRRRGRRGLRLRLGRDDRGHRGAARCWPARPTSLGVAVPDDDRWTVTDATLGPGYGVPTPEATAAIELLARTEGVLLDPVYTAKAMAHLLAAIARRIGCRRTATWSSSTPAALPGLFAYAPALAP